MNRSRSTAHLISRGRSNALVSRASASSRSAPPRCSTAPSQPASSSSACAITMLESDLIPAVKNYLSANGGHPQAPVLYDEFGKIGWVLEGLHPERGHVEDMPPTWAAAHARSECYSQNADSCAICPGDDRCFRAAPGRETGLGSDRPFHLRYGQLRRGSLNVC